jgi:hypothetical protein
VRKTGKFNIIVLASLMFLGVFDVSRALTMQEIIIGQQGRVLGASTNGLVGYWNFDEGSGNVAHDTSGNGNDGTITGATWTTGKVGSGALSFNGVDGKVTIPGNASLNPSEITISFWINVKAAPSNNNGSIIDKNGTSGYRIRCGGYNPCQPQFVFNGSTQASGVNLSLNTWAHIAVVGSSSGSRMYVNGVAGNLDPDPYVASASAGNLLIGAGPSNNINEVLDDVRLYNRALTPAEILDIYNDTGSIITPPPPPGDTEAPSVLTNVLATAVSSSAVNLSWTAATDNVAVTGYKIFRNGTQIGTSATADYADIGLNPATSYSYTVSAYDAAGNASAQSAAATATTQDVALPPSPPAPGQVKFFDDFERGDFSAWDGVGATAIDGTGSSEAVSTEHAHSGLYSFKSSAPKVGSSQIIVGSSHVSPLQCDHVHIGANNLDPTNSTCDTPANAQEMYMRFWIYIDPSWTMPANTQINIGSLGGGELLRIVSVGSNCSVAPGCNFYLKDLAYRQGTHSLGNSLDGNRSWHSIEIHSKAGSGNGIVEVWVDGALDVSAYNLTIAGPIGPSSNLGLDNVGTDTGAIFFDDVVFATVPIGSPAVSMTIRRPNTAARIGMPVDVTLWGQSPSDTLTATVDGNTVYRKAGSITSHERFAITGMGSWAAGNHPFTVQLTSGTGSVKATFSDTLRKYKDGTPTVSIDENDNVIVGGHNYFPVGMFADSITDWNTWHNTHNAINTYCCSSGYTNGLAYTPQQFGNFLDQLGGAWAIGPNDNMTGRAVGPPPNNQAIIPASLPTAPTTAAAYVAANAGKNIFMWTWDDESDMGVGQGHTPVLQSLALTQVTHDGDPNHPVWQNLLGYEKPQVAVPNDRYYPVVPNSHDLTADIYITDTYPIIYQNDPTGWTFKKWVLYLDRLHRYVFDTTPVMQYVEAITSNASHHGPTGQQVLMEAWLATIHGAKGIFWWMKLGVVSDEQYAAAAKFNAQIADLHDIVLSSHPSRTVSDNSNADGNRVDTMVREDANNIWVFAARLSELSEASSAPISTQFSISGLSGNKIAMVYSEGRNVPVSNGVFTDSFAPYEVHIYQIPKSGTSDTTPPAAPTGVNVQ